METVFKEGLFRVDYVAVFADTDEEVDFFTGFLVRVPDKVFRQFVGINHDGWLLDGTSPEKHVKYLFRTGGEGFFTKSFTFFVDKSTLRTKDDYRRVFLESFKLEFKPLRKHDVISVHAGNPFRFSLFNEFVGSFGNTKLFFVGEDLDTFVFFLI